MLKLPTLEGKYYYSTTIKVGNKILRNTLNLNYALFIGTKYDIPVKNYQLPIADLLCLFYNAEYNQYDSPGQLSYS